MPFANRVGIVAALLTFSVLPSRADDLEVILDVDRQPLMSATSRLIEALDYAGSPLSDEQKEKLSRAKNEPNDLKAVRYVQEVLDPLCLMEININPESRVKVKEGPVKKTLLQGSFRAYLVKVHNEAGINPELVVESPHSAPVYQRGRGPRQRPRSEQDLVDPSEVTDRWLDISLMRREPMRPKLSGLQVEYKVVLLNSRDAGKREASIAFNIGQGTQDIGFRNSVPILFDCRAGVDVTFGIKDVDGTGYDGGAGH